MDLPPSPFNAKPLPPLRRSSSSGALISGGEAGGAIGSSAMRAIRTSRLLRAQLEGVPNANLIEVRKALATLQGAGLLEVADVSGLHETVVAKLAAVPAQQGASEPEVMLSPMLQTGLLFDFTQEQIENTDDIGKGLQGLRTLRSLRVRFCKCAVSDMHGLGKGIRELSALKELHIDLAGCTNLASVEALAKGIAVLYGLETLYLNFNGCSSLESVKVLAEAIAALTGLRTLTLNFQDCSKLTTDAAVAVGSAIAALPALVDLDLNVCGSRVRRGVQRRTILEPGPVGITNYMMNGSGYAACSKVGAPLPSSPGN